VDPDHHRLDFVVGFAGSGDDPRLEDPEDDGWCCREWDDNTVRLEQSPVLQEGAVHRGPAAVEQHGERFHGQGDLQMEHGGQDLFGEREPGRAAARDVAVEGQSPCEKVQLLPGHAGQDGIGQ
jgi:hypothetical protein